MFVTIPGLDDEEPQPPNLKLLDVNLVGVLYTAKLAGYYFNKQSWETFDRCLILVSSIMGYVDTQGSSVYGSAKHGVRGAMCCLRRKGAMRVNAIAPWYACEIAMTANIEMVDHDAGSLLHPSCQRTLWSRSGISSGLRD